MLVFDVFKTVPYTFLQIRRGKVKGNIIQATFEATGVFKLRSDMVVLPNGEVQEGNATLHIRAGEDFLAANQYNLTGHGITIDGKDFEIIGQSNGVNFHNGVLEHYLVTLKDTEFADYES